MKVTFIALADAANMSQENKLNILGIFNVVWASAFPAVHPQLQLVMNFEASKAEEGKTKKLEIQLTDADGQQLMRINGKMIVPKGEHGQPICMNHILPLSAIRFDKAGDYRFYVLVNGDVQAEAPLRVRKLEAK